SGSARPGTALHQGAAVGRGKRGIGIDRRFIGKGHPFGGALFLSSTYLISRYSTICCSSPWSSLGSAVLKSSYRASRVGKAESRGLGRFSLEPTETSARSIPSEVW